MNRCSHMFHRVFTHISSRTHFAHLGRSVVSKNPFNPKDLLNIVLLAVYIAYTPETPLLFRPLIRITNFRNRPPIMHSLKFPIFHLNLLLGSSRFTATRFNVLRHFCLKVSLEGEWGLACGGGERKSPNQRESSCQALGINLI